MDIITNLGNLITALSGWLALLSLPILGVVATKSGIKYASSDDPHEAKAAFDLLKKAAIGCAIAVSGTYLAGVIMGYLK
ncbi:hypothetical protein CN514_07625 [Bacillus sp. AFS001701]|uniref:pilin n=1 Tax=Bacillus sp. AFS001701 TaxID=2033480 RepID=UPI000BFA6E0B|nr:pilin [Bacillus sp. AFS001701]PET71258.1 hypothetical protein CN514_07625 [Bacillus sp. AFS001701]